MDWLEVFWEKLLSREAEQIAAAWHSLPDEYHRDVRDHLCRMCTEEGWHLEQIRSAEAALNVIDQLPGGTKEKK